jgi:hypothetical protein
VDVALTKDEAVRLATEFANANGYRVVSSFDGVEWSNNPYPIKFGGAGVIRGEWRVSSDLLLPPEVESQCPDDMLVIVDSETGECRIYPLL